MLKQILKPLPADHLSTFIKYQDRWQKFNTQCQRNLPRLLIIYLWESPIIVPKIRITFIHSDRNHFEHAGVDFIYFIYNFFQTRRRSNAAPTPISRKVQPKIPKCQLLYVRSFFMLRGHRSKFGQVIVDHYKFNNGKIIESSQQIILQGYEFYINGNKSQSLIIQPHFYGQNQNLHQYQKIKIKMCENYSDSIGTWQLVPSMVAVSSTALNICFLIRHWDEVAAIDMQVLNILSLLSFGLTLTLSTIAGIVFTDGVIFNKRLRVLFVLMSQFNLVKLYIFLYQRFQIFGARLRIVQQKLAKANFSIQLFQLLLNYSLQLMVQYQYYKKYQTQSFVDAFTYMMLVLILSFIGGSIILKTGSLMCFDEEHWARKRIFMGICCCQFSQYQNTRPYYESYDQILSDSVTATNYH